MLCGAGEPNEVAEAIGEQYLSVPKSKIALAVALADRIDSLVGLFAAVLLPPAQKTRLVCAVPPSAWFNLCSNMEFRLICRKR